MNYFIKSNKNRHKHTLRPTKKSCEGIDLFLFHWWLIIHTLGDGQKTWMPKADATRPTGSDVHWDVSGAVGCNEEQEQEKLQRKIPCPYPVCSFTDLPYEFKS
jgi:hypothetical protein